MERWELDEIGKKIEEKVTVLFKTTVLESDARLKLGTPVDTGRLRAAWQIGEGVTPRSVPVEAAPGKKHGDIGRVNVITSPSTSGMNIVRTGPKGTNYQPTKEKLTHEYIIANNLEYAEPICYGTGRPESWVKGGVTGSTQNPPPWVEGIAKGMQKFVDYNWDKIVRETN